MRVLITGNMGYVGPVLVERLRSRYPGATLIGVDTCFFGQCLTSRASLPESRLDVQHFADVRRLDASLLKGVDVLVMLAAISNDPMGKAFEAVTADVNRHACARLTGLAKEAGVGHVVFASSCSVYGFAEGGARDETAPVNPLTAYAHSKIDTEKDIAPLAGDGLTITSLRFPTACGFSPRLRLDLVLNDLVASALATGKIEVLSDGTPWRPLIDVRDMARAIEWAGQRPAGAHPFLAINVGRNECNYQIKDLAQAVANKISGTTVSVNTEAPPDKRSYRVDFGLYRELAPDALPACSLDDSIDGLKQGLEAIGFADSRFRESDYIRLKVLSRLSEQGLVDDSLYWVRQ
jgi:nucleoside-diphosphate-sugar epimerase